jgi:hypothetical protein
MCALLRSSTSPCIGLPLLATPLALAPCRTQDPLKEPVPADDVDAAQWYPVAQLRGLPGEPAACACCQVLMQVSACAPPSDASLPVLPDRIFPGSKRPYLGPSPRTAAAVAGMSDGCSALHARCDCFAGLLPAAADLVVQCDRVAERAVKHFTISHE